MAKFEIDKIDFDKCQEEPIHIPESIQEYGFYFALDSETFQPKVYSANYDQLFNDESDVLSRSFFDVLDLEKKELDFIHDSYHRAKQRDTRLPVEISFKKQYLADTNQKDFHAIVYESQGYFVLEIEPHIKFMRSHYAKQYSKLYSANIAPRYKEMETVDELAYSITDTVQKLTGYERVVLYRFNTDNSGRVIAESKVEDMDSYLNLYYPAGDIPKQARELYIKNWIRLTPDVDLTPIPLLPRAKEMNRERMDLSKSLVRAMSPIHLQYVRNQGLKSSMSISLVSHGDLWGLISCHHRQKHYIPQNIRIDCEELSQLFSWQLYAKEEEIRLKRKEKIETFVETILAGLSSRRSIVDIFQEKKKEILETMGVCGFVFKFNKLKMVLGDVPSRDLLAEIQEAGENDEVKVWSSNYLERELGVEDGTLEQKGVLYIPLTKEFNCYTAWFRKEKFQIQKWAGHPDEHKFNSDKKKRLEPRSSFKVHKVEIRNRSEEWSKNDVEIAEKFHKLFLSYSLSQQEDMQANITFLEEKDQTKDEFLATLAHELRNPLTPMENAIAILEENLDTTGTENEKIFNILKRQQSQLGTLVNDLLDVSQITRRRMSLKIEKVKLTDLLISAIDMSASKMSAKNQTIDLQFTDESVFVKGDFGRLLQAFGNVVNNASKYTDNGGKVEISGMVRENVVEIDIKDSGIGLTDAQIQNVFEMFSQVDASENTRGGLGIGLTLTQKIIDLHNGQIKVRSKGLGHGSIFSITLPLARSNKKADRELTTRAGVRLAGLDVLIIDDNEDILQTLRFLLEKRGMHVTTANSGEKGITVFKNEEFDFVVLDIGLPDLSGYEVCKELKNIANKSIFIAQSGWGQPEDIKKAKDAGFDLHLTKPVKISELVDAMESFLD